MLRASELTHGWVRLARAGVLGGASLFLATAAHGIGGGTLPGPGLLAVLGGVLAVASVSLTARRLRFGLLLGLLAAEQVLLHVVLHAASTASVCAAVMPGHAMSSPTICGTASAAVGTTWAMVIGHGFALVATAWLLSTGERWLWQLVEETYRRATARPTRARRLRAAVPSRVTLPYARPDWLVTAPRGPPLA